MAFGDVGGQEMFCKNCGKELREGSSFCSNCGTKIEGILAENEEKKVNGEMMPKLERSTSPKYNTASYFDDNAKKQQIIGKHVNYYLEQFETIQKSGKSKMNWASFFFGFLHSVYRNVWKDWFKAMRFPLIAELAGGLLTVISALFFPKLVIVFYVIVMLVNIWLFITQILFAKRFNQIYMQHVKQKLTKDDQKPDVSIKRVILTYLAIVVLAILVRGIITAVTMKSLSLRIGNSSSFDYDFDSELQNYRGQDIFQDFEEFGNLEESEEPLEEKIDNMTEFGSGISVSDIFVSNFADEVSWYSDTAGYYMIPYMEEKTPVVLFTAENNTFYYSTVYYATIISIEPTSNGGLVCSGPMFLNTKETAEENGTVEITWDSWETIDYPSIKMISGHQMTDISMIADDYYYWGPVESDENEDKNYIFFDSDRRLLTETDVMGLSAEQLRIAKNEIYARRGRMFTSEDLKAYFESKPWYQGYIPAEEFSESILSQIEKNNIAFIQKYIDQPLSSSGDSGYASRGLAINDPQAIPQIPGTYCYYSDPSDKNSISMELNIDNGFIYVSFNEDGHQYQRSITLYNMNDQEYVNDTGTIGIYFDDYGRTATYYNDESGYLNGSYTYLP